MFVIRHKGKVIMYNLESSDNIIQGIHKRMVRFHKNSLLIPHHSFVYALYIQKCNFVFHWYIDFYYAFQHLKKCRYVITNIFRCASEGDVAKNVS
jgi:hypothetical protein